MRKLERIIDTIINAQSPSAVLVTGGDQGIYDYLTTRVDNVVTTFNSTDSFDLIVVSGTEIDTSVVKVFGNTTTVVIEENQGGRLKNRNTGHLHMSSFGEFVYLTEDSPHIIMYSRDPYVVRDVGGYTPTTPAPAPAPAPTVTTEAPVTLEDEDHFEFESGIDETPPDPPSYYWKPSIRGTE